MAAALRLSVVVGVPPGDCEKASVDRAPKEMSGRARLCGGNDRPEPSRAIPPLGTVGSKISTPLFPSERALKFADVYGIAVDELSAARDLSVRI